MREYSVIIRVRKIAKGDY